MTKEQIKQIVSQLTLEEKAALSSGKNFWQSVDIERLGIPNIFFSDGPNGLRKQSIDAADNLGLNESRKSTCFPTSVTTASSWDESMCENIGRALGREATALDVGVLLGPGTNIKRDPLCGRNFEYLSEDPYLAGKCVSGLIRGIQEFAASACVKHFALNNQETGRMYVDSVVDERAMREIYLTPFEMAVKQGDVHTIMSSYNRLNGEYTNENKHLLVDILRNEWGYEGVVLTDWGGDNDRVQAAMCGNEIEMPTSDGYSINAIIEAVNAGVLDMATLDANTERLLTLAFKTKEVLDNGDKTYDVEQNHNFAYEAAKGSMVLLKNDGALPLNPTEKVCFIGDFAKKARYQGGGSACVNPTKLDNVIDVIGPEDPINFIGYAQGFDQYGKKSKKLVKEAIALAQQAEKIVFFIGLDDVTESEGKDRDDMKIPTNQLELLAELKKLGKPIVCVLSCGSPVETDWDEDINALLCVYLTGQAGAQAILDNLMGKVNPSGKLAETFPVRYEDTPAANYYLKNEMTAEYRESVFVGYRYYEKAGVAPKYPFGFGLSYTTFAYSDLQVNENGVTFTLTNTGAVDGAEVAQMYVGAVGSKVFRPVKELKGFTKVFLKAGESKQVEIPFDEYTFRYFNVKANEWQIEDCDYNVMVGSSSANMLLTASYKPEGGVSAEGVYDEAALANYFAGDIKNVPDDQFELLLGRPIPDPDLKFINKKKTRIIVDYNTSVLQLRYAKGWTGRAFSWGVRFGEKLFRKMGNHKMANLLKIGPYYLPIRGMNRMSGGALDMNQVDGLVIMFNGKFFKGLGHFLKATSQRGKAKKAAAKAAKAAEEAKAQEEQK